MTDQKWPRQYAAEIIAERSRARRRELLDQVPEHLKAWVKWHVMTSFERRKR